MNAIIALFRRASMGGVVTLILSFVLKHGLTATGYLKLILMISPLLYLLFVFLSWLSAKSTAAGISEQIGVDIPENNYIITLIRAIPIDILSPITVIIDLFRDSSTKVIMFIITYAIVIVYVGIWFFVL